MPIAPRFFQLRRSVAGDLGQVVSESWLVEAERCRTAVERVLPDAAIELHFNLGSRGRDLFNGRIGHISQRAAWVTGPHATSLLVQKETADCDMVGVRLLPGVCEQVLGVPAIELRDSLVDLDALWGPVVERIRERLYEARGSRARLEMVERVISERLVGSHASSDAALTRQLCLSLSSAPPATVGELAAKYGVTHRRVIAIFDREVGVKPKAFHRIDRLRRVLNHFHGDGPSSWTRIAHACGYFDQAHLINDFHLQVGLTPVEYARSHSSIGRGFVPYLLADAVE